MMWGVARKKPVEVKFREVIPDAPSHDREWINTREGTLCGYKDKDYIILGIEGELYPIKKTIFDRTYEVIKSIDNGEVRSEKQ